MAVPTITRNLAYSPDAEVAYNERGQWLTATNYNVDDLVYNGIASYVSLSAHLSDALTEPGAGADWDTAWEAIFSIDETDVVPVINPGATWAPVLQNGQAYYVEGSNPTDVAPANAPGTNRLIHSVLWIKGGSGLTWSGVTLDTTVNLSADAAVIDKVVLENANLNGVGQGWRATQVGTTAAASVLPSAIDHEWLFESDWADSIGTRDWTPVAGASIAGSSPFGAVFSEASSQYATLTGLLEDPNANLTIFIALPDIRSSPSGNDTLISMGDGGAGQNDYVVLWQLANGNLVLHLDNAGVNSIDIPILNANLPVGQGLFMIQRSGTTWKLQCLTNGVESTGTYSDVLTLSGSALGARYKQGAFDHYATRTILAMWSADVAITSQADLDAVRTYAQTVRGLSV